METGLWTVEFFSSLGLGGNGIAVLKDKRILGGDAGYYYEGTYSLENGKFTGTITVIRYDKNIISVFGDIDKFSFDFEGTLLSDEYSIRASVKGYNFQSKGKKRAEF
jgi:hypothetical protein